MFTIKVTNIKDGSIQSSDFETKEQCQSWIKHCEENGLWGESGSHTVEVSEAKALPLEDISARQLEMALLAFNIDSDMVEEAIRKLPEIKDKKLALIAWRRSGKFVRSEQSVSLIGKLLGLDDEKLDSIWINGFKL